jgi:hypothetical protein
MVKSCIEIVVAATFVLGSVPAQEVVKDSDLQSQRTDRVRRLSDELRFKNADDIKLMTKEYVESRVAQIRAIVREQMLDTLRRTDTLEKVRGSVMAVLGYSEQLDDRAHSSAYVADLKGQRAVVVGYNVLYGGSAIPNSKVVIEAYRQVGAIYEFVAQTGETLENCDLSLDQLDSPRGTEAWFLARGRLFGPMDYQEIVRIYSFDGYQFRELWAPAAPKYRPEYQITRDSLTVTYASEYIYDELFRKRQDRMRDIVQLTSGGPVVSTAKLP